MDSTFKVESIYHFFHFSKYKKFIENTNKKFKNEKIS